MAVDDSLIGKKLGDYTIQALLGRGGMSRVYRGFDENLQRYAAVKVISGDFATTTEEEYTRRFASEARAIAHLRHLNIVGVYQFGRTEGIYYMAQVFLEGDDLRTLLREYAERNQALPEEDILRIARDVASALDYAHQQGVIHRDIKPSNIMLEKVTGRAILMDFGLALSIHEGTMGDTFGSAHYIAPEQAVSSAKAIPASDQYSFGVVLYEMLVGQVPFDDPSIMSVALKHLNESPPALTEYNPDLSPLVENVVLRALSKDPNQRFASLTALVDALEAAFRGEELPDADEAAFVPADHRGWETPGEADAGALEVGLAGRFARRRAQKEQIASRSRRLDESELQLDEESLDSLLQTMDQPLEQSRSQSSRESSGSLFGPPSEPSAEHALREAVVGVGKKRRTGRLVFLLLVLIVVGAAAAWFGLGLGGDDSGQALTGADQTATVMAESEILTLPTAEPQADVTATGEDEIASATPFRPTATRMPTVTPTEEPTVIPSDTPSTQPTETATAEPSLTAVPSLTPTRAPTNTATKVPEPTPTEQVATPVAVMETVEAAREPNIRVFYDEDEFVLVNVSDDSLDITGLLFEHEIDGALRSFNTSAWDRPDIAIKPDVMLSGGCYQLITLTASQVVPDHERCPFFLGFLSSSVTRRYFWLDDDPAAEFTVRFSDSDEVLATCSIAAGECAFYAGEITNGAQPDGTVDGDGGEAPTVGSDSGDTAELPAGQTGEPTLRLIYDEQAVLLVNISEEPQDVSGLHFVLELPNGLVRSFLSAEWDDAGIVGETAALPANSCLELVTSEADVIIPVDQTCASFLGWFRSNLSERYFWISPMAGQSFAVRLANKDAVLALCATEAGVCEFNIPD